MQLTGKQKSSLRGMAHDKNPVVSIGSQGLSESVLSEIEIALEHHELIKIKLPAGDKQERSTMLTKACSETLSEPIQLIGRVGVLYRKAKKSKIELV
jgi:RNA-binding protein